jgi:hypothetical protein
VPVGSAKVAGAPEVLYARPDPGAELEMEPGTRSQPGEIESEALGKGRV